MSEAWALDGVGWPDGNKLTKPSGKQLRRRRKKLFMADPHCYYCGEKLEFMFSTLDHKIPRSRGGKNGDNLVLCCEECNQKKANRTSQEFFDELTGETSRIERDNEVREDGPVGRGDRQGDCGLLPVIDSEMEGSPAPAISAAHHGG